MRIPKENSPHYKFYKRIEEGGRVWRNDRLNDKQEWLDLDKLDGDATKIVLYGYMGLYLEEEIK